MFGSANLHDIVKTIIEPAQSMTRDDGHVFVTRKFNFYTATGYKFTVTTFGDSLSDVQIEEK